MGPPGKAVTGNPNPLTLLFQQHPQLSPIFGVWLGSSHDWRGMGQLTLGGLDRDHLKGPLTWSPSISTSLWMLEMQGVSLGDRLLSDEPAGAVIDTGSSLLVAPRDQFQEIVRLLAATPHPRRSGLYQVESFLIYCRWRIAGSGECRCLVFALRGFGISSPPRTT